MFEAFRLDHIDVGQARLRVRYGGTGPAVLLVHGHPRTHATWHRVAPALVAAGYRVVCPDLRGYGQSGGPPDQPDHSQASKRAMAADLARLMQVLGHDRYAAVGHDRGGYVVQRLALDHPGAVSRAVILGDVPIGEALARCDARFAQSWWHWFFMGQPAPLAERLIGPDRDADDADRAAGRKITAPLLVLWGTRDDLADLYDDDVLGVWQPWAEDLSGFALRSGHHMSEEAPRELSQALLNFFRQASD